MDFVRSIARTVTVLHEGSVLAEGDMDTCRTIRASSKCIWRCAGIVAMLAIHGSTSSTAAATSFGTWTCWCPRVVHLPHGPQRHGQDHAAQVHHGAAARASGSIDARTRRRELRGRGRPARRLGIAYVPQGREIFSQLTVEENLRIGLGARRGADPRDPDTSSSGSRC
jgi:ABC-type uncharacterized transport system ATPase subunit